MASKGRNRQGRKAVAATLIALAVLGAFLILLAAVSHTKYRTCVQLANGANLGYEAMFDLSRPFLRPLAVPRLGDGTPIVRDEMWSLKVSDTTIYGLSLATDDARGYRFAWRTDTGLVLEADRPVEYERLVAEAGPANTGVDTNNVGTQWLMNELAARPGFETGHCPTALITW